MNGVQGSRGAGVKGEILKDEKGEGVKGEMPKSESAHLRERLPSLKNNACTR